MTDTTRHSSPSLTTVPIAHWSAKRASSLRSDATRYVLGLRRSRAAVGSPWVRVIDARFFS